MVRSQPRPRRSEIRFCRFALRGWGVSPHDLAAGQPAWLKTGDQMVAAQTLTTIFSRVADPRYERLVY